MSVNAINIVQLKHHDQNDVCTTRARYRQGRKETAVKVYTINQESKYLLIFGVPAVGLQNELRHLCEGYGEITRLDVVHEYPCEEFTEVYIVCYIKIQTAKFVKRKLDGHSFFGGVLHVCYAPEFESIEDTRQKLISRQRYVNGGQYGPWTKPNVVYKPRLPSVIPTPPTLLPDPSSQSTDFDPCAGSSGTYIWAGKVYSLQQAAAGTNEAEGSPTSIPSPTPMPLPRTSHLLPRQLRPPKRKMVIHTSPQKTVGHTQQTLKADSFENSSTNIRNKMSQTKTPTLATCFKRKRY